MVGEGGEFPQARVAKEQKGQHNAEKILFTAGEVFDQASNGYMALYYCRRWHGGCYRNDVKPREFDKSVGMNLVGCCVIWEMMFLRFT